MHYETTTQLQVSHTLALDKLKHLRAYLLHGANRAKQAYDIARNNRNRVQSHVLLYRKNHLVQNCCFINKYQIKCCFINK